MKVSVSLPEEDLVYIDEYAHRTGASSRSSVLHQAVSLLRLREIESAYESAWTEWKDSDEQDQWDRTAGDGLHNATR